MKKEIGVFYQTYRLYVFPILIALSSLILIAFVIYPQLLKLITNQKLSGEFKDRAKLLEAKAQELESLDSQDLRSKVNFALEFYPADTDFGAALSLLQNLTIQQDFELVSMGLGSTQSQTANLYSIKMEISGARQFLPSLLVKIENSPRLMRVSRVEVSSGKDTEVSAALEVEVLYAAAPSAIGSVDSPLVNLSQEDEAVLEKLAKIEVKPQPITDDSIPVVPAGQLGPRGKLNPFE